MAQAERRSITRRALVAASAALPMGPGLRAFAHPAAVAPAFGAARPAVAGEAAADPIHAVIAAHARAHAEVIALLDAQLATDTALQEADAAARPALEARLDRLCKAEWPLGKAEMRAAERLRDTMPAT